MQNVVHSSKCDNLRDSDLNESIKDHSGSSSPLSGNITVERGPSVASLQAHFMAELSESDDDDVSEVESFILEQGELDEEPVLDTSKFLLANDCSENGIDAETQCRLEALLEASGQFFENQLDSVCSASTSYSGVGMLAFTDGMYTNQDVLKKLTSSVNCALDEAAVALSRMRPCSSLAEACSHGDISAVKKLLEQGRNVNEVTEEGESLLSLACSSGYLELAQLLLAMKANVEDRGLKDMTPLMEAANAGNEDIVRLLIQHGADVNAQTSQDKKVKGGKCKSSNQEKQQSTDVHGSGGIPSIVCPEGNSALMFACAAGHVGIARLLLDAGAHVEDHNENGHTPLMEAASAGHVAVAKLLVERGASINTHSNEFKESALTLACYKGHLEMVRFLLEAGADREHKTDEMHTALMEASMDGHVDVARLLLDSGAQVNMPADSFESPLTLAACGGHVELALLLLDRGANIEEVNDEGYTPLMEAAREGHEEMVSLLLSQGADINAQTEETQETALTLACCGGFLEVADFLIKAGADIEVGASTPLMEAAQEGHLELVRYLISSGSNVNATTNTGDAALTYACENGHTDVADLLLQAGSKLEHESEGGRTPLMKAARAGHLCTVQFLISKGADVNKQTTNNDHTPLSLACAGGHITVVELLLAHGADPAHKLKDNSTMLIEASKGGHTAVVQMLLDYPNSMMANPPPPPDMSQIANATLETEAPRVPPHGLQAFHPQESESNSYLANIQAVPRIQDLLRETLPTTAPQAVQKQKSGQRKSSLVKNSEAPSSFCDNAHRYYFRRTNSSAHATSISIQTENGISHVDFMPSGGGGNVEPVDDDMRPSERLEQCINSMMKKAELLHPSPEEQILQKQQILEELQRVERELQEKAQAQLLLTAQHQQHHQNLHSLGTMVTSCPVTTVTGSTAGSFPVGTAALSPAAQQLLMNRDLALDIQSLSSLTDISTMSSNLGLNLRSSTSSAVSFPTTTMTGTQVLMPNKQKILYDQKFLQELSASLTTTTPATEYCKARLAKMKQSKSNMSKQAAPLQQQIPFQMQTGQLLNDINVEVPPLLEECTSNLMTLRDVALRKEQQQQQQQQQAQLQQQLLQQHSQQQFVLSEFTQNLTLRGTQYYEGAIDGLMHAMGRIKLATDGSQTHAIPMYDPVTVGQALLQQQQQHLVLHQQLTQTVPQETKKLQLESDQQTQPIQQLQHQFERNIKLLKGKTKLQQQSFLHGQRIGQRICAAHLAQQVPQANKQQPSSCGEACTFRNIPLEGTGVLTMSGSQPFPVSIAVTPVSLSPEAINCGSTFTNNITLDEGLMVAAPARTLHDTLGEIVSGPTTQLAGTHMNLLQQTGHCSDACLNLSTGKSRSHSLSAPGVPTTAAVPLNFHTLPPTTTPCVLLPTTVNTDCASHHMHTAVAPSNPAPPAYPPLDLNSQTDSNHDTALTLACNGGHEELVNLLLARGADIEHHDKKGFFPLMLSATVGHAGVVEILLNNAADIEGQVERTKDTALSLACSGGRYEVVDILLARGANKEHRNVSDYTPLSLAASGGYVNIIKLLLSHGAEINSRTGSKLGISPLMLAAMNGHAQAVKLLLDMGSDINAQIETNRNTALTLACFQGRTEVVSLLLDRKANVEHRAKTGLTPLMEAASGGYVEVGKVLIDKGADVNAPPVPSSRDTALTIAADKGHYRFVQLLLERDATVEVKNKKGNSPLWLAANGGHLEVVQLLCANNADIDSQDNRKVSCLMAAFRKGHVKVVKWMVKYVSQFPSDQEMARYMSTIGDKELLKKCSQGVDTIRIAKEHQAAEANKNANILLEELDLERCKEENRKAAAARRRERKRQKKREKQEQLRAAKVAEEELKNFEKDDSSKHLFGHQSDQSDLEDDDDDEEEDDDDYEEENKENETNVSQARLTSSISPTKSKPSIPSTSPPPELKTKENVPSLPEDVQNPAYVRSSNEPSRSEKKRDRDKVKTQEKNKRNIISKPISSENTKSAVELIVAEKHAPKVSEIVTVITSSTISNCNRNSKKRNQKPEGSNSTTLPVVTFKSITSVTTATSSPPIYTTAMDMKGLNANHKHLKQKDLIMNGLASSTMNEYNEFCALFSQPSSLRLKSRSSVDKLGLDSLGELALELPTEVALSAGLRSPSAPNLSHGMKSNLVSSTSPKKWQKRDEGWKEVVRSKLFNRSKKVCVPANAISRVIGRGGMNINAIRESSGAHIEVEKQKGQGDRTVIIRGSADSTCIAQQLITALIKEPEKELSEILSRCGLSRSASASSAFPDNTFRSSLPVTATVSSNPNKSSRQQSAGKTPGNSVVSVAKPASIPPPSLPANSAPPFANQTRSVVSGSQNIRPSVCPSVTHPFLNNGQNAWTGVVMSGKIAGSVPRPAVPTSTTSPPLNVTAVTTRVITTTTIEKCPVARQLFPQDNGSLPTGSTTATKTTVSYTMAVIAQGKTPKTVPAIVSIATKVTATADTKVSTISPITIERAGSAPPSSAVTQVTLGQGICSGPVQPFTSNSPKISNGSIVTQSGAVPARIQTLQAPSQSKPFVNVSNQKDTSSNPSISSNATQSAIAQEYSPFNNIFAKVAQSVWGQKEKETSKPNFASVAASGVTSVAAPIQNSVPIQSTLTLSLPQTTEPELVVDAAKAPGYRGNLHISPSASSNPPQIVMPHNSNFGPIGSGPRSAPCTPPLGPIGPPSSIASSTRHSTPPASSSPPPTAPHLPRSLPDTQAVALNELPRSMPGLASSHMSSQMSEGIFQHQSINMPNRMQSFQITTSLTSPSGTNTTFSQHSPLSSILPEGGGGAIQVVQSNLNPNAPDFSSRTSLLMAQHGPSIHLQRPSTSYQEASVVPPHLAQFRPILASSSNMNPGFPLHAAMTSSQTQASINRFPFHHMSNHHQQSDFNASNSAGGMGSVMSQDADAMPLLSMAPGYHHPQNVGPGTLAHYPGIQNIMGIRPNQRSSSTTPSLGTSSKDEGSPLAAMSPSASPQGSNLSSPTAGIQENPAGTIGEDRKLPRPIGMERAQRKNPMFGGVSDVGGIWSFCSSSSSGRSDLPGSSEWLQSMQGNPLHSQEEASLPPSLHHGYASNRFADVMGMEANHPMEQSFQTVASGGFPFVNGLHPHLLAPQLYPGGQHHLEQQQEMWSNLASKNPSADNMQQNPVDHKMQTWQSWSPHQA